MKDARILQALSRASEVGLVLFLAVLLSGCRSGGDRVNLIVRAGSQNPGAAPGPVGHTDVAVLQILLLAGEASIDVTGLRLHASGTGDDALGIGQVRLFRDQSGNGILDAGDTLLVAAGGFSSDDGTVLLSGFREAISRTAPVYWLIVYDLAPGVSAGETFCPSVIDRFDVQAERSGRPTDDIYVSPGIVGCMEASPGELTLSPGPDNSPPRTLGPCVASEVILQIDLAASPIEGVRVDSIAFTASGSGDDAASIDGVTLAVDANDNGIFDGFDIPIASTSGYPADDGTIIFPSLNRLLPAGSAERWILVYDLIWPFSMGDSFAASVGGPSDVVAIGDSSGNSLAVLGTPVDGGLVSMDQIRILSARFEDTNASGIADQGDRILVTMSHDVMLQNPRFADDIFSVLPGTLGRARIGTGPSLRELEIVLESAHDIAPHGTAGIDPGSSGMNVWLGQTELLDCQGLPVLPATSEIDLTGDLRPRVVLAGISDVNGNCVVDAGDTLDVTFTTTVTVMTADPDQAFVLPVSGDAFGTAPRFIGGGAPTNVMKVSIVLGAGSVLTSTGAFDPVSLSAGSPSGLDVTAIAGVVVDAQYAGISALPNATAAIDVTDAPLWESVGDDWMDADFGWSVAWAGDVDGNTYPDIIVGAPRFTGVSIDHGKAYLYLGGPGGLSTTPAWTSVGDGQAGARYGFSVASVGDVNNDTYSDIIVGAPGFDGGGPGTGKVYVYLGGPGGLATVPVWTSLGEDQAGAAFGHSVALAGNVNGDVYADLVIGARQYDTPNAEAGKAYLYLGESGGVGTTPLWTSIGDDQTFAFFGGSVASAGDVDNNGLDDLIVGAPGFDGVQENQGKAYLFLSIGGAPSPFADWTSSGDGQADARFGTAVASAGDVSDDTRDDVIVGAPGFNNEAGKAYVFHGQSGGLTTTWPWSSSGADVANAGFGRSVASAGDVDGDMIPDVIVGAFGQDTRKTGAGRIYIYLGATGGLSASSYWSTSGDDKVSAQFGLSVATAGDTDGDLRSEILVGAPGFDTSNGRVGKAYVFCVP